MKHSKDVTPLSSFAPTDMFDMILKFGSGIVDGLRDYKQPVIIYIPPNAELRGGAWAVLDTKINPEYIEMYADQEARCVGMCVFVRVCVCICMVLCVYLRLSKSG